MPTPNDLPRLSGLHVMVVNDSADDVAAVATALQRCGASVTTRSAEVALRVLRGVTPQVLVVVQSAATSDTESFIRTIRSRFPERAEMIPAIGLHEHGDDTARAAALAAGYWEYLSGPVDRDELPEIIARMIGRRSRSD